CARDQPYKISGDEYGLHSW
nr:immunoglobulin heavy chain junction region [Macaca mulatta]